MAKGSNFERDICTQLSLWWSKNQYSDIFWRTSMSGGRATVRHRKRKLTRGQHGDVCATHKSGLGLIRYFTIELKRGYNRFTPFDILDRLRRSKDPPWLEWIRKAERSRRIARSVSWLIIARRDRRRALVAIPTDTANKIITLPATYVRLRFPEFSVTIFRFDEFLKRVKPEYIRNQQERRR